jgi:rhodanese-related sulfurtransferase
LEVKRGFIYLTTINDARLIRIVVRRSESGVVGVPIELVSVEDTWARLAADPGAVLIDVRTVAEWSYVGIADLSTIGKQPILIEWQTFPSSQVNAAFVDQLKDALAAVAADQSSELLFLCRSGVRSLRAAEAMTAAGFTRCRNVADGFEGPLDPDRHRGRLGGWKAKGLPWVQG